MHSFKLRPWLVSDQDSVVKYANNPNIAKYLTDGFPHPYTMEDAEKFINLYKDVCPANCLAIEVGGEAAGSIGVFPQSDIHSKNAEMGYWLGEEFWGKGIMTGVIREMVAYTFENFDVNRIFARPFGTNIASQKVLEKSGFKLEAVFEKTLYKNGEYLDEMIYAIRKK